ncbi:MAG: 4Fe-4S dicluster domain-containing protein [Desulforudis sp.]|nr:MAG: 4Fe-4S dicluster domain-containing protein [Desulforudis sp.]
MAENPPVINHLQTRPQPVYRQDLCIACGACVGACRAGALTLKPDFEKARVIWRFVPEACTGCGRCARYCPTGAITITAPGHLHEYFQIIRRYCPTGAITITPPADELTLSKAVKETSFPLQKCSCCGNHYASAFAIAHLATFLPDTFLSTCTACRRSKTAHSLTLQLLKIHPPNSLADVPVRDSGSLFKSRVSYRTEGSKRGRAR